MTELKSKRSTLERIVREGKAQIAERSRSLNEWITETARVERMLITVNERIGNGEDLVSDAISETK
jgi:hypothetical protein